MVFVSNKLNLHNSLAMADVLLLVNLSPLFSLPPFSSLFFPFFSLSISSLPSPLLSLSSLLYLPFSVTVTPFPLCFLSPSSFSPSLLPLRFTLTSPLPFILLPFIHRTFFLSLPSPPLSPGFSTPLRLPSPFPFHPSFHAPFLPSPFYLDYPSTPPPLLLSPLHSLLPPFLLPSFIISASCLLPSSILGLFTSSSLPTISYITILRTVIIIFFYEGGQVGWGGVGIVTVI